jgi:hypothetical protein
VVFQPFSRSDFNCSALAWTALRLTNCATHPPSAPSPELRAALEGHYSEHFRYLLTELLDDLARLDGKLEAITQRLRLYMIPYQELIQRMCQVP